jgi:hypothetical protein
MKGGQTSKGLPFAGDKIAGSSISAARKPGLTKSLSGCQSARLDTIGKFHLP